ncbi:hypothetical protein HYR82_01165 [Candidatus Peregrinibacteria bacterium]|nr:hypothetical protein [Candidatus Peregrinibacteria bacterium]
MKKEDAIAKGWNWRENLPVTKGKETMQWRAIPFDIAKVDDLILHGVFACEATGKNFKITKQELEFYRQSRLPVPRLHPDERHRMRMALRNPRKLWNRTCAKCGKEVETSYAPERPEIVYCESCYLEVVY